MDNNLIRKEMIRSELKRGDKKRIAAALGVTPEWVSMAITGNGVSERVLSYAEALIAERESGKVN